MEDRETPRMRQYGASTRKTTRIMMATVPHVTSGSEVTLDFCSTECTRSHEIGCFVKTHTKMPLQNSPGKGHWLLVILWILGGEGGVKFDYEGNRNFHRNARKVWHFDTVWYPEGSTLNTSTERLSAASIVHSNVVKLPIQLRST